jgi:hypothetical protein
MKPKSRREYNIRMDLNDSHVAQKMSVDGFL